LWIKLADRGFAPVEVTLARLAMGALVLFAIVLARREKTPRSLRLWATVGVAALFANAVPYLLFAIANGVGGERPGDCPRMGRPRYRMAGGDPPLRMTRHRAMRTPGVARPPCQASSRRARR
jgi:hypothetical protein